MDIDLPKRWTNKGGRVEQSYYVAVNNNGVCVGYDYITSNSYSIWAGNNWDDNKTLNASCNSETEAKLELLNFMREHPDVRYKSGRGIGTLYDGNDDIIY